MSSTLIIQIKPKLQNGLVGFPYTSDVQFLDGEFEAEGRHYLVVALPDREDISVAMEQHLNSNEDVISYEVR